MKKLNEKIDLTLESIFLRDDDPYALWANTLIRQDRSAFAGARHRILDGRYQKIINGMSLILDDTSYENKQHRLLTDNTNCSREYFALYLDMFGSHKDTDPERDPWSEMFYRESKKCLRCGDKLHFSINQVRSFDSTCERCNNEMVAKEPFTL